jgi:hypothetical protein
MPSKAKHRYVAYQKILGDTQDNKPRTTMIIDTHLAQRLEYADARHNADYALVREQLWPGVGADVAQIGDGCDLAMVLTTPGSTSERNVQRAGFRVAYTKPTLIQPTQAEKRKQDEGSCLHPASCFILSINRAAW